MASKKGKKEDEVKPKLGRPGNNLKMGIVGLPNVGKSTLFNTLCKMAIPAENFPFCTIEPNVSRVPIPDTRFEQLCAAFQPKSMVPTYLTVTDIAGLVRGAHEGEGLGNAFLSHIGAVDGVYHVCRVFEDEDVTHVEGHVDPVRDLEIIGEELRLKDIDHMKKEVTKMEAVVQRQDKTKKGDLEIMKKVLELLQDGKDVRTVDWSSKEIEVINPLLLLTAKPVVYLVNMTPKDYMRKKNKFLGKIKQWIDAHGGGPIIPFCGKFETEMAEMDEATREAFLKENNTVSVIPKIITTGYHALDLIHFFTCGADEVRCWTIRQGTLAPQAAGTIHTDFEKGFVCAEVYSFADFVEHKTEAEVKAAGLYKQQGKKYQVCDGDIVFFKANTSGLKKKK